jgi:hypothetical protein
MQVAYEDRLGLQLKSILDHHKVQCAFKGIRPGSRPVINIVAWKHDIERIWDEYNVLIRYIRGKGFSCSAIDPNDLIFKGKDVYNPMTKEKVDLLCRRFIYENIGKFSRTGYDLAKKLDSCNASVVNPICTKIVGTKNILPIIMDEHYHDLFDPKTYQYVKKVRSNIPWSRKVEKTIRVGSDVLDTEEYLLKNKDTLVLKGSNSYASNEVFIGRNIDEISWASLVSDALGKEYIVQREVSLPKMNVDIYNGKKITNHNLFYNINPYYFDEMFGGLYIRASSDKLTSFKTSSVATVIPNFISKP